MRSLQRVLTVLGVAGAARLLASQPGVGDQLLALLSDPTLLFLLFVAAAIGVYLELAHPGAIVPGAVGSLALLLFLFGAGALDPNWAGLALMLLAIVLLAVDVRAATHGALTLGALLAFAFGSFIFFDTGAHAAAPLVSPYVIGGVALGLGLFALLVLWYALVSSRGRRLTGGDGLIGAVATVTEPVAPGSAVSWVRVLGELWEARLTDASRQAGARLEPGRQVRVKARDNLTLLVEPLRT